MKLTSLSVIFIIIIIPFLFITNTQARTIREDLKLRQYYDNVIDNAVFDAAHILSENRKNLSYSESGNMSEARILAAQHFFDILYHAFGVYGNRSSMDRVESCVPVLIFLENESFCLYALNKYKGEEDYTEIKHCWFPQRYYMGEVLSNRYIVRYTLGNKVYVFDQELMIMHEGEYSEFEDIIPLFKDSQGFENLRITAIAQSVENAFSHYLEQYSRSILNNSLAAELKFPRIEYADWKRALKDEGIIVFASGFPVLKGKNYQHYALGGGRVIRKAPFIGYYYNDFPYYCRTDCTFLQNEILKNQDYNPEDIIYFSNAFQAAKNGYMPCSRCRP
jgi:hypothetical protein